MPAASGTAITQLMPYGLPGRRYGSFAGKATAVPSVEGMEFTLPTNRMHYTLTATPMHHTLPTERMHHTLPEDD